MSQPSEQKVRWIEYDSDTYWAATRLRYRIFFQNHGVDKSIVQAIPNREYEHAVIEHQGELLAYGRLTQLDNGLFQISQMVVEPAWQRLGLGSLLLDSLIRRTKQKGGQQITLNARVTKMGFYEKHDFEARGNIFSSESTGLPHIEMIRSLARDI